jgi:hypothetical protein
MSQLLRSQSPPGTPESAIRNSLYHATSTVDDLTAALADFSRVPSPEPPTVLACCCRNEDCENVKCWLAVKSKLESRLILSAGGKIPSSFIRTSKLSMYDVQRLAKPSCADTKHTFADTRQVFRSSLLSPRSDLLLQTPTREGPSDYEQSSPSEEHIESRVVELLQENLNLEKVGWEKCSHRGSTTSSASA